jgi:hypothetical protein
MESTERLGLLLVQPGQAAKEATVNESLVALDLLVAGAVEEPPVNAPPASPGTGQCWIVGASPSGAWAGKPGHVAGYTAAGWRLIAPTDGMVLIVRSTGTFATYRGGAWDIGEVRTGSVKVAGQQVIGAQQAAIANPSGGSTVDAEARTALAAILAALRGHGLISS